MINTNNTQAAMSTNRMQPDLEGFHRELSRTEPTYIGMVPATGSFEENMARMELANRLTDSYQSFVSSDKPSDAQKQLAQLLLNLILPLISQVDIGATGIK